MPSCEKSQTSAGAYKPDRSAAKKNSPLVQQCGRLILHEEPKGKHVNTFYYLNKVWIFSLEQEVHFPAIFPPGTDPAMTYW